MANRPVYPDLIVIDAKNYLRARHSFQGQMVRCYKKNHRQYPINGGRGIRVLYSEREFITWWLNQPHKNDLKIPTCGRIDHNGNYELSNIIMEEKSDNSQERCRRVISPVQSKPVLIFNYFTKEKIGVAQSTEEAARMTGYRQSGVSKICHGIMYKNKSGISYEFV